MSVIKAWFRLLRPQQWLKNTLVLAPLFFSGNLRNGDSSLQTLAATLAFCLLASAVYILNDLRDHEADKRHKTKCTRPIAAGTIGRREAALGMLLLLIVSFGLASALLASRLNTLLILTVYLGLNVGYSFGLKHVPLLELFIVASGFVLRLLMGGEAIGISLSPWILICTGLISLLVVVGKRRADIALNNDPHTERKSLSHYSVAYLDHLTVVLGGSTIVSYLMFCVSDYGLRHYGNIVVLTGAFVVFGIFRYLQLIMMNGRGDDPTDILIHDPMLGSTLVGWAGVFFGLIYL